MICKPRFFRYTGSEQLWELGLADAAAVFPAVAFLIFKKRMVHLGNRIQGTERDDA